MTNIKGIEILNSPPCVECITRSICISNIKQNMMPYEIIGYLSRKCILFYDYYNYATAEYYKIFGRFLFPRPLIEYTFPVLKERIQYVRKNSSN